MKEKSRWIIECKPSPETIDRIMLPIRKRGISVLNMSYSQKNIDLAICEVEFELDSEETERIKKNFMRLQDVITVKKA
jgi:acetolactate synthase regulatory subunit